MTVPNRWWVGLNTAVNNKTAFGTGSPIGGGEIFNPEPSGYESMPSGNASDDMAFAAAAKKNAAGGPGTPVTISVENINWYNVRGPYKTQAEANAAIPGIQNANPAPGVLGSIANSGIPGLSQGAGALQDVQSWGQAIVDIEKRVTDPQWWLRVAEFAIGAGLILVGVLRLTGVDASKATGAIGMAAKVIK